MRNIVRFALSLGLLALLASPAAAEMLNYGLSIPAGQPGNFSVDFEVPYGGTLSLTAMWSGSRVLSFRLEPPDPALPTARRSGLSPQRINVGIDPGVGATGIWTLVIRALSGRQAANGTITIHVPEEPTAPEIPRGPGRNPDAVGRRPVESEPWTLSRSAPPGAGRHWTVLFKSIDHFRAQVVTDTAAGRHDNCRWKTELLQYLTAERDRLYDEQTAPSTATRKVLRYLVEGVNSVESLRTSSDPSMVGPPDDEVARRQWVRERRERLREIEARLDRALGAIRRGHAPDLKDETWPVRMISCVTACERNFEERVRLGPERASNQDLARAQWPRLLAAADALAALADLRE